MQTLVRNRSSSTALLKKLEIQNRDLDLKLNETIARMNGFQDQLRTAAAAAPATTSPSEPTSTPATTTEAAATSTPATFFEEAFKQVIWRLRKFNNNFFHEKPGCPDIFKDFYVLESKVEVTPHVQHFYLGCAGLPYFSWCMIPK
jgi:hypothetical protein